MPVSFSNDSNDIREKLISRVLNFNPKDLYDRINDLGCLDPYLRHPKVSLSIIFPKQGRFCSCGCGIELKGRQTRWSNKQCSDFAVNIFNIINGRVETIKFFRSKIIGGLKCEKCGESEHFFAHDLDHIIPVAHGGGGGWISNYQILCKKCHREKTNNDFGFKLKDKQQLKMHND
ncbi:MAG: HNH endonuclease signature motif containing protein [Chitinophagales bacterium]